MRVGKWKSRNEESLRRGREAFSIVPGPLVGAKAQEVNLMTDN
jgi:hypothetical protein